MNTRIHNIVWSEDLTNNITAKTTTKRIVKTLVDFILVIVTGVLFYTLLWFGLCFIL